MPPTFGEIVLPRSGASIGSSGVAGRADAGGYCCEQLSIEPSATQPGRGPDVAALLASNVREEPTQLNYDPRETVPRNPLRNGADSPNRPKR
jgi:hypothetical protein